MSYCAQDTQTEHYHHVCHFITGVDGDRSPGIFTAVGSHRVGGCFHQCTLRPFPLVLKLFDKIGFLSSDCLGEDLRPEMQLLHQYTDISSVQQRCFQVYSELNV